MYSSETCGPTSIGDLDNDSLLRRPSWDAKGARSSLRRLIEDDSSREATDIELTQCLLDLACKKGNNWNSANELVRVFGSFGKVLSAPVTDLAKNSSVNKHGIAAIKLMHATILRMARAQAFDQQRRMHPEHFRTYLHVAMSREKVEQTRVFFFDKTSRLIAEKVLWIGTTNHTPMYISEVAREGLRRQASRLIVVHNHPSGDPTPSAADSRMTAQMSLTLELVSIELWDHVIVGNGRVFSFNQGEWTDTTRNRH